MERKNLAELWGRLHDVIRKTTFHLLLLVIIGFVSYANTFKVPFTFDDGYQTENNPLIRKVGTLISADNKHEYYNARRFVGYLIFALNYKLHGIDVTGYHAVNLLIHLVNALLVYAFVTLTFRTPYFRSRRSAVSWQSSADSLEQRSLLAPDYARLFALAVALLFVAHPMQTQAVTYVSQRFASLASMFCLLSLVLYITGRIVHAEIQEQDKKKHIPLTIFCLLLSFVAAVLAMKTKEISFTLPILIMLYEFVFFGARLKKKLLFLLPFALTLAIIPLSIVGSIKPVGELLSDVSESTRVQTGIARWDYLLTQMRVITTYLRLLFLPINQNLDYDYPVYHELFDVPVLLSFLLLVALLGGAVYLLIKTRQGAVGSETLAMEGGSAPERGELKEAAVASAFDSSLNGYARLIGFGILWFFIALSVESSLIPIVDVMFEHRVYLPSVGFFIAVVAAAWIVAVRAAAIWPKAKPAMISLGISVVSILTVATVARNSIWQDDLTLWSDTARKSPAKARPLINRGLAFFGREQFERAIEDYSGAINLDPDDRTAYYNRALVFTETGQYDKAINDYIAAIVSSPSYMDAYLNLGALYARVGKTGLAIQTLSKAVAIDPKNSIGYVNLALAYSQINRLDLAVENYIRAVKVDPSYSNAYHGLGTAYVRLGQLDNALAAYSRFVELSPNNPEAYRNRGNVYAYKGDFASAGADFRKACALGSRESCTYLRDPKFQRGEIKAY